MLLRVIFIKTVSLQSIWRLWLKESVAAAGGLMVQAYFVLFSMTGPAVI